MASWKMSSKTKKAAIFAATILLVYAPQAHAQSLNLLSCFIGGGGLLGCALYGITLFINSLIGMLIMLAAWLFRLSLVFNADVVNSPAVQGGFGVALSIANLGFVLAIIVIALATILRNQTYGIKQLLFKLISAAILVNFSLVIAGAILGFSNSLTNYFMNAMSPTASSTGVVGTSLDYINAVNTITQKFAPQSFFRPPSVEGAPPVECITGGKFWAYLCGFVSGAAEGVKNLTINDTSKLFSMLLGMILSIIFSFSILFTFAALAIMLLIRYAYLAVLLILSPLVWLLWIFPNTKSHFSKWWNHFIRWTFFPPIVVFFLYLAILTATNTTYTANVVTPTNLSNANGRTVQEAGLIQAVTPESVGTLAQIPGTLILVALALGGLFAANSLSIMGAGVAMGVAKSAGGAIQGFAFKQGKRGAGALVPTKVKEKLETGGYKFMPKRMQAGVATAFRKVEKAGKADQVEANMKAARDLWKNDPEAAKRLLNSGQGPGLRGGVSSDMGLALMKVAAEEGKTKGLKVGGKSFKKFVDENERMLQSYGQGKAFDKATLSNKAVRDAEKALEAAKAAGTGIKEAAKRLDDATKEFVEGLEKSDMYKADVNEIFSEKNDRSEALAKAFAKYAPQLVPNTMVNMTGPTIKMYSKIYKKQLDEAVDETAKDATLSQSDKDDMLSRLAFAEDAFDRAYANNAFGFSPKESQQTGGTTPPPTGGGVKNP